MCVDLKLGKAADHLKQVPTFHFGCSPSLGNVFLLSTARVRDNVPAGSQGLRKAYAPVPSLSYCNNRPISFSECLSRLQPRSFCEKVASPRHLFAASLAVNSIVISAILSLTTQNIMTVKNR